MATEYDIIIRNGVIIDGSGNPWFRGDISIKDGRIKHIGQMGGADAMHELEANGLVVVPGFIDIHAHSDFTLLVDPLAESKIRQGVTTEIVGQCGESAAPITDETAEYSEETHPSFYRDYFTITWRTMSEYCDVLSTNGLSMNVVPFIGHETVRKNVMGFENRPPTAEELEQMKTFVRDAMEQGAFGLSSGLFYMPGGFAQTDELIELCRVVREYRGIYASHIRNESDYVADAVKEAIEIGRKSGIPVQISHLKASGCMNWGKTQDMLNLIEAARNEGIEVTADVYPWTASSTGLDAGLPSWVHEGGVE
ncbi:MAG: amidohydrolase family protein, partial [Desulfobacterales bacterium]|nr:amidohydrolase family protein [Desulfobacterales bacterium]